MGQIKFKKVFSIIILVSLVVLCYLWSVLIDSIDLLKAFLWKVGVCLGGRALSFALCKLGCSSWIALAISFAVRGIAGETSDLAHYMLPGSSHEPREPSDESSSALSALDERKDQLIQENVKERKGDLGDGQRVSEVRQGVEQDFQISTKGEEFELIKQLSKEVKAKNEPSPVTNCAFNSIKEHEALTQDGKGGGKPTDCSSKEKQHKALE